MGLPFGVAMGSRSASEAAFAAALEHIPAATFLVSGRGRILVANRTGAMWLAANRTQRAMLTQPGGPDPSRFEVTAFGTGTSRQYLAMLRRLVAPGRDSRVEIRFAIKARIWSLTRRETEVARWILRGATNRVIADALGCSLKTIEHHVSSILRKGDLENRASLIVAIHDE